MKIEFILKGILGIVLLAFFMGMGTSYTGDNFLINIFIKIPFWICLFIFFNWREWVTYENQKEKK